MPELCLVVLPIQVLVVIRGSNKGLDDYWVVKINARGNIQLDETFRGNSVDNLSKGGQDYWIVKLCNLNSQPSSHQANGIIAEQSAQVKDITAETSIIRLFPNPRRGQFVIELHLENKVNANAKIE